jgi:hypothetical protein
MVVQLILKTSYKRSVLIALLQLQDLNHSLTNSIDPAMLMNRQALKCMDVKCSPSL